MLKVKPFQETLNAGMCGPASLKIVLDHYGLEKSEQELAKLTENDKDLGATAENIAETARKLGFMAEIKNKCEFADIEEWLDKDVPVIVDWFTQGRKDYPEEIASADGHYSVVCGLDNVHIFLQDPEIGGMRKMKRDVFKRVWFDFKGEYINPDELIIRQIIAIYRLDMK
ncbi:MAG: cysteine peptidase family C39 domain-containing protein [Candidatus Moranbacteria bacterium]|nr:cysteine peptidase family C39 domain-containing protein [Candidatus Moranbacteria bacterium]MDD5652360.1 cysteine peptidase family C39 domain-containing protein [Candidatus Moranbacteria bacterium]MDX9855709.1 cysteine peptidase family C39 domain-containing protein [Candidatus Moranbacteria bacterium]